MRTIWIRTSTLTSTRAVPTAAAPGQRRCGKPHPPVTLPTESFAMGSHLRSSSGGREVDSPRHKIRSLQLVASRTGAHRRMLMLIVGGRQSLDTLDHLC